MKPAIAAVAAATVLAACRPAPNSAPAPAPVSAPPRVAAPKPVSLPPVEPRAPGTPGGLPDDRTPLSEAPFTPQSAQGAADVVQTYFAHIGEKQYAKAWRLWARGGEASDQDEATFVAGFGVYAQYSAQVGAPGEIEGAAGSLFVEVPVQVYGRMKSGEEFHLYGPVRLRRVNDVDGSTAGQRLWHIDAMELKPS